MPKNNKMNIEKQANSRPLRPLLFSIAKKRGPLSLMLLTGMVLSYSLPAMACEACKQQQPKFLKGITHGAGPDSNWDYVVVVIMVLITLYSLFATVKCMIRPSEKDNEHIKRMILNP